MSDGAAEALGQSSPAPRQSEPEPSRSATPPVASREARKGETVSNAILTVDRRPRRPVARAFTLVELLIVVTILGILAAIVVPQFVSANSESRDSAMLMNLSRIRTQLQIYQSQHNGNWPTLANFANQLTMATNISGATAPVGTAGYPLGPYLQAIPINPWIPSNSVAATGVGTSGWYYNEATGDFRPNDSARTNAF